MACRSKYNANIRSAATRKWKMVDKLKRVCYMATYAFYLGKKTLIYMRRRGASEKAEKRKKSISQKIQARTQAVPIPLRTGLLMQSIQRLVTRDDIDARP